MSTQQLRAVIRNLRSVEATYLNLGVTDAVETARRLRRAARLELRTRTGGRRRSN
jgi:hypothetical protein